MPYRRLRDHSKIIEYTAQFLRGWAIQKEHRLSLGDRNYVQFDLFAVNNELKVALIIEAKTSSDNKTISGGIGQLLFYRELLSAKTDFNDILFALAVPGSILNHKITKEGTIKLEKPSYALPISNEAYDFVRNHNIGIFIAMENGVVRLATKFPLSLWLLMKDLESTQ